MKHIFSGLLLTVLASSGATQPPPAPAAIHGRVFFNSRSWGDAKIYVTDTKMTRVYGTAASLNRGQGPDHGFYQITNLPAGEDLVVWAVHPASASFVSATKVRLSPNAYQQTHLTIPLSFQDPGLEDNPLERLRLLLTQADAAEGNQGDASKLKELAKQQPPPAQKKGMGAGTKSLLISAGILGAAVGYAELSSTGSGSSSSSSGGSTGSGGGGVPFSINGTWNNCAGSATIGGCNLISSGSMQFSQSGVSVSGNLTIRLEQSFSTSTTCNVWRGRGGSVQISGSISNATASGGLLRLSAGGGTSTNGSIIASGIQSVQFNINNMAVASLGTVSLQGFVCLRN